MPNPIKNNPFSLARQALAHKRAELNEQPSGFGISAAVFPDAPLSDVTLQAADRFYFACDNGYDAHATAHILAAAARMRDFDVAPNLFKSVPNANYSYSDRIKRGSITLPDYGSVAAMEKALNKLQHIFTHAESFTLTDCSILPDGEYRGIRVKGDVLANIITAVVNDLMSALDRKPDTHLVGSQSGEMFVVIKPADYQQILGYISHGKER